MLELFQEVTDTSRPDLPDDHPIMCYYRENDSSAVSSGTLLRYIFATYPGLKERMKEIHPNLKILTTPLTRVMLQQVTIADVSKRSGIPEKELIAAIKEKIARL